MLELSKISKLKGCRGVKLKSFLSLLILTFLSFLLMAAEGAYAATYYVAPTGYDTAPGTSSAPWGTFAHAMTVLQPGDTLYLENGTYNQTLNVTVSGTSNAYITIKALNPGSAIVSTTYDGGTSTPRALSIAGAATNPISYVEIDDINFRNSGPYDSSTYCATDGINYKDVDGIYVYWADHLILRRVTSNGSSGCNSAPINMWHVSNSLLEDCAASGQGRVVLNMLAMCSDANGNVIPGCTNVIRRGWFNWTGPYTGGGDDGAVDQVYDSDNLIFENSIHTNYSTTSVNFFYVWAHYASHAGNVFRGNIAYSNGTSQPMPDGLGDFAGCGHTISGTIFDNNVVIDSANGSWGYGSILGRVDNSDPSNGTTFSNNNFIGPNNANYTSTGIYLTGDGTCPGQSASVKNVYNNSIWGTTKGLAADSNTSNYLKAHDYNNFYDVTNCVYNENYLTPAGLNAHEACNTTNPNYNTSTYGLGAYLMVPTALKGQGQGGADIGASVIYEYANGVLTNTPLWPWPMENRIVAEFGISPTYANDGKGHTGGFWNTLTGVYGSSGSSSGTSSADTTPPSVPAGITTTVASSSQINLAWTASTDPTVTGQTTSGVAGYDVYRNGSKIAAVTTTNYSDSGLSPATTYSYTVDAYDNAGNRSAQSNAVKATTQTVAYTITATAGTGGSISPAGATAVNSGGSQTYTVAPSSGYSISSVQADGVSAGSVSSYTFSSVTANHTISATFTSTSTTSASTSTSASASTSTSTATSTYTATDTYISDLNWTSATNGWGPLPQKDKSNGDPGTNDQQTITLHGVKYAKGIGCHAQSVITYNLGGQYTSFVSDIGIDDEVGSGGSVVFQVWADGVKLYDSGTMTHASPTQTVNVDVTGKNQLQLIANVGAASSNDHADWAGAYLASQPMTYISDLNWTSATNGWGPLPQKDKSNGDPGANDQQTITIAGVKYVKGIGCHAQSIITYNLAGNYARFISDIGIDDEVLPEGGGGSVEFQVWGDGTKLYDSGTSPYITSGQPAQHINVSVAGVNTLTLKILVGSTSTNDHADWAGAYLIGAQSTVSGSTTSSTSSAAGTSAPPTPAPDTTPPTVPTSLTAAAVSSSQINLTWAVSTDNVGVAGYKIYRNGSLLTSVTTGTTYSDAGLSASTTYSYSVSAYDAAGNVSAQSGSVSAATSSNSASPATVSTYVSDLTWISGTTGWGNVIGIDKSCGQNGTGDGTTISLLGVKYAKGLGVSANSVVTYKLGGQYSSFVSDIGIDDEVGSGGSVRFQVWADGILLYDSGLMTHGSATQHVNVDVTGKSQLQLVANVGTTNGNDHADWAGASLVSGQTPPIVPTSLSGASSLPGGSSYISNLTWISGTTGWGNVIGIDKSCGQNGTGDGTTISINGVKYAKGLGVNAVSEVTYNLAGQYTRFVSNIGIDDDTSSGSVIFEVWADGIQLYNSGTMNKGCAAQTVDVDVTGKSQLQLIVNNGATQVGNHADWAGAYLY